MMSYLLRIGQVLPELSGKFHQGPFSIVSCLMHAGRKKVLGCSAALAGLSGLAGAAAPTYWWYLALRVCSGVAAGGMTLAGRALATEPIGPSWRGVAGVATCFFSILGGLITVLIAFLVG